MTLLNVGKIYSASPSNELSILFTNICISRTIYCIWKYSLSFSLSCLSLPLLMPILAAWMPMEGITTARQVNTITTGNWWRMTLNQRPRKRHTGLAQREKPIIKDAGITVLVKGMPVISQVTWIARSAVEFWNDNFISVTFFLRVLKLAKLNIEIFIIWVFLKIESLNEFIISFLKYQILLINQN